MKHILIWDSDFGYTEGIILCALTNQYHLDKLADVEAAAFLH